MIRDWKLEELQITFTSLFYFKVDESLQNL